MEMGWQDGSVVRALAMSARLYVPGPWSLPKTAQGVGFHLHSQGSRGGRDRRVTTSSRRLWPEFVYRIRNSKRPCLKTEQKEETESQKTFSYRTGVPTSQNNSDVKMKFEGGFAQVQCWFCRPSTCI